MSTNADRLRVSHFPVSRKSFPQKFKSSRTQRPTRGSSKDSIFTLFPRLPPEIRNMIWLHSVSPRVVTIHHNLPSYHNYLEPKRPDLVRRSDINEEFPALLYVCCESRSLVLPLYTSVFPSPSSGPPKWHYTGSLRALDLASVQKELGLMLLNPQNTTLKDLIKSFETAMNTQPPAVATTQSFTAFATFYRKPNGTVCPTFFNTDRDTIYLRRSPQSHHFVKGRFLTGLWCPKKNLQAHAIRHLAIELDNLTYPGPRYGEPHTRRWCTQFASAALTGLESLSLICLEDREVIIFKLDTTHLLQGREWSYSLFLSSPSEANFAPQMKDKKTSVTWNVQLAVAEDKNLWHLVKAWRPKWDEWEDEKRTICEEIEKGEMEMVGQEWFMTRRVYGWCRMLRKPELVGGGDGKTWMGKSRAGR